MPQPEIVFRLTDIGPKSTSKIYDGFGGFIFSLLKYFEISYMEKRTSSNFSSSPPYYIFAFLQKGKDSNINKARVMLKVLIENLPFDIEFLEKRPHIAEFNEIKFKLVYKWESEKQPNVFYERFGKVIDSLSDLFLITLVNREGSTRRCNFVVIPKPGAVFIKTPTKTIRQLAQENCFDIPSMRRK